MPQNLAILSDVTVELEATFTDSDGAAIDPSVVELTIELAGDTAITLTRANGDLTNPEVGTWQYRYKFEDPGGYKYTWFGDDPASDSSQKAQGRVTVRAV